MSYIAAIDVAQYQGTIDWSKIGEPIVMLRLSFGDAGLGYDTQASKNYYGAKAAGKHVGCYHFAGGGDPVTEADFFLRGMQPLEENDVMCLDWEIQHANPVQWVQAWMTRIHDKTGVWPLLYINLSTLNSFDWSPVLANCGLWIADWNNNPDGPAVTSHTYVMQQYNDGPWCDHDAWFGTVEEFDKYGYHAPATPPAPTPTLPPAQTPTPTPEPPVTPPQPTVTVSPAPPVRITFPAPKPAPTPATQTTAPAKKVVVPEPTYFSVWELLVAVFKKLLGRV